MRRLALAAALLVAPLTPVAAQHEGGRYVVVMGDSIWVEVAGTRGPWLVLIGGGPGGSHDYFHPHFDALESDFRVVYYDAFGSGRSARVGPGEHYTFERHVEELEALRQSLGVPEWAVLGHSYGGFVAQAYALRYPAGTSRLILASTLLSPGRDLQETTSNLNGQISVFLPETWERIAVLREAGVLASEPAMQEAYFGGIATILALFYFHDPRHAASVVFSEETFNPEVYYGIMGPDVDFVVGGDVAELDFEGQVAALAMPVLVIGGRADGIVPPRWLLRYRRALPAARVAILEQSGHFPFVEETDRYMTILRGFLASERQ